MRSRSSSCRMRKRHDRVTGLRVGDVPVARGDLREQAENRIPDVAVARDQLPGAAGEEPVRLRVVELVANDRQRERLELVRVHLIVARHHGGRIHPRGQRALVARDDRGADTAVALVDDHLDARVVDRPRAIGRRVGRGVVDDEDPVDEPRDPLQRGRDQPLLVVGRDDDGDGLSFEHRRSFALQKKRTRSRTQIALKPSRQVIFLPSA